MLDKFLVLDTIKGKQRFRDDRDPFMPTQVNGQEGISQPFFFDVTMIRGSDDAPFDPAAMIGTQARVGMLSRKSHAQQYSFRTGMFQTFSILPKAKGGRQVYTGRIVPAVVMLGRRVRFRVFEQVDAVHVITTVLKDMQGTGDLLRFDLSRLANARFATMNYCVQFGESDWGFLSRLMRRHGIWYMFDRPGSSDSDSGGMMDAINNTLVLGTGIVTSPTPCDISKVTVKASDKPGQKGAPTDAGDAPDMDELVEVRRIVDLPVATVRGSDFNPLDPTTLTTSLTFASTPYDLTPGQPSDRETFPVRSDPDSASGSSGVAAGTVDGWLVASVQDEESRSFTVAGSSSNSTMLPGRLIEVASDESGAGAKGKFLIRTSVVTAYENSYFTSTGDDFVSFLKTLGLDIVSPVTNIFTQAGGQGLVDLAFGATQAGLNNYLQNEQALAWQTVFYPHHSRPDESLFWPFTVGGMTQGALGGLVGLIGKGIDDAIKEAFTNNAGAYSNSFVAVPDKGIGFLAPLPVTETPKVAGPHLAVVIGPKGIDTSDGDIYADAIGRVRIRFAWDIVAARWNDIGKTPLACDDTTCWVRVTDGWAGAKFGTQFLPRIGQEVVVEFLNGDPECPIVTGRVYNAAGAKLPFPSPAAEGGTVARLSDLPGTAAHDITRSGIKTKSMKVGAGADASAGFHMIRFDDKSGAEQLLLRAQGRRDDTSVGSRYETTEGNRHVLVTAGKDKSGNTVGGGSFTSIAGEADLDVGKDLYVRAKGKFDLQVTGDVGVDMKGAANLKAADTMTLNAQEIVIEAQTKLSLKVGGSFVVLTAGAIYINAPIVNVNSGGSPSSAAPFDVTDPAGAAKADPGTPPNWLQIQKPAHGGGSRTHKVDPLHGVEPKGDGPHDLNIGGTEQHHGREVHFGWERHAGEEDHEGPEEHRGSESHSGKQTFPETEPVQ